MAEQKDRVKGPAIFFLSIFMLYSIVLVIDYLFFSTYKLETSYNVLRVILSVIMIISTVFFMIFFIKNQVRAKLWLHISAATYVLSNIISLIQVLIFPSGNQVVTGPSKIGPIPVQILFIVIAIFYWFMLNSYFKMHKEKYV